MGDIGHGRGQWDLARMPSGHERRPCGRTAGRLPRCTAVPASSACGAGMDSPCIGIFQRLRMAVMESVRHAAVGGPAAGGRTMKGREARKARSCGTPWPRPGRQGPAGHSPAGAETGGRAPRDGERPCDGAWCEAGKRGRGRPAGRREGPGGANCVTRGALHETKRPKTMSCRALQALRDGSAQVRLARDNCCYREPICQIRRFRPAPRRLPGLDSAIVGPVAPICNPMIP